MVKKFLRKHGILFILLSIITVVFLVGFFVGRCTADAKEVSRVSTPAPMAMRSDATIKEMPKAEKEPQTVEVVATAYCACEKCCGNYAKNRPNGIVYTASGAVAKANHTIAVDPDVFPFGTVLEIGGVEYTAEDTGSAVVGNVVDIYFDSHKDALAFGRQTMTATIKE